MRAASLILGGVQKAFRVATLAALGDIEPARQFMQGGVLLMLQSHVCKVSESENNGISILSISDFA
jgi:hypothetical protein